MIVADAGVVTEWLLGRSGVGSAVNREPVSEFNCPHIADLEVLNSLKRMERAGKLPQRSAGEAAGRLSVAPMTRHDVQPVLPLVWGLRHNLSIYDASYVALFLALEADQLWTFDRGFAEAAAKHLGADRVRHFKHAS